MNLNEAAIGDPIQEFTVTPTHADVFMFSAVTWNRHHIHYSKDAAVSEGLPDVVVQRSLIGNYFIRALVNWSGKLNCVRNIEWKMKSSSIPNETLTVSGKVTALIKRENILRCDLSVVSSSGRIIAEATAKISC